MNDGELAAFVTDECRTATAYVEDGLRFLTIPGEGQGATINLLFHDGENLLLAAETLIYDDDASVGSIDNPFVIDLDKATDDIASLYSVAVNTGDVYDLNGRMVLKGKSDLRKLPKGVYIRNGQKLVVK